MRRADAEEAPVGERRPSGNALERDAAERVHVARRCRFPATDELGRQIVQRPEHLATGSRSATEKSVSGSGKPTWTTFSVGDVTRRAR